MTNVLKFRRPRKKRQVEPLNHIDALADAWASIDGKMKEFRRERDQVVAGRLDYDAPDYTGNYEGYVEDAREMIKRLERRGYTVVKTGIRRA